MLKEKQSRLLCRSVCAVLEYWQACSVDEKGRYLGRKEEQENSAGRDSACVVGSSHYSDKVTRTP